MGSCISKCKPKSNTNPHNHVQDKLVISQAPPLSLTPPPPPPPPRKLPLCPSPSPTYSSSFSSLSKNNSTELTSSLSSASSCSSSILTSKDRSFSNDFLWSCAKENPQIISLDTLKDRVHQQKLELLTKQNVAPAKQSISGTLVKSTKQKRARANSPTPTLTRQKSFRVEVPEKKNYVHSRNLRSPSPSRRFNGDNYTNCRGGLSTYSTKESCGSTSNRTSISTCSVNYARNKENIRLSSPSNRLSRDQSYSRNRETCNQKNISSKVEDVGIKEFGPVDVLMEDIDNPLNSVLDCFIFL